MEFRCFLIGKTNYCRFLRKLSFKKIQLMPKYIMGGEEKGDTS